MRKWKSTTGATIAFTDTAALYVAKLCTINRTQWRQGDLASIRSIIAFWVTSLNIS